MDNHAGPSNEDEIDSEEEETIHHFMAEVVLPITSIRTNIPRHTSRLPEGDWVGEVIMGHDGRFFDNMRLTRTHFADLVSLLEARGLIQDCPQTRVSCFESLAIFMRTVGMHLRQLDNMERFQHSGETVNRHIHRIIDALVSLAPEFISHPNYEYIHPPILNNNDLFPFFEGCVGAMDGTLIPATVLIPRQNVFRSRKSTTAQNVCAICDFDMQFNYVYAGWEGSASDAHVLTNAIRSDATHFPWPPDGRFYSVDAGYANYGPFLAPYRNVRYHLPEWNAVGITAQTEKELFNHRHARLRHCIERAFGVLKSRFPILRYGMPSYTLSNQVKMVIACCVIHNFVRRHALPDPLFEGVHPHYHPDTLIFSATTYPNPHNVEIQNDTKAQMTAAMWAATNGHG